MKNYDFLVYRAYLISPLVALYLTTLVPFAPCFFSTFAQFCACALVPCVDVFLNDFPPNFLVFLGSPFLIGIIYKTTFDNIRIIIKPVHFRRVN